MLDKIDPRIIRAIPSNDLMYLLTFMPGLFFLSALALANPSLTSQLTATLQFTIPTDHYTTLFTAFLLFSAFVIGATFVSLVALIQYLPMRYACSLWFYSKPRFWKHVALPVLNRLLKPSPKPKPRWLINSLNWLHRKAMNIAFPPQAYQQPAFRWWKALTNQLLMKRFGFEDTNLPQISMDPLRQVLTEPTPSERRGDAVTFALHATGWSALAATYFAPDLRTTWFHLFAFFLIAIGLFHDFVVIKHLIDPNIGDTLRLRAVLREFPKLKTQDEDQQ